MVKQVGAQKFNYLGKIKNWNKDYDISLDPESLNQESNNNFCCEGSMLWTQSYKCSY